MAFENSVLVEIGLTIWQKPNNCTFVFSVSFVTQVNHFCIAGLRDVFLCFFSIDFVFEQGPPPFPVDFDYYEKQRSNPK